MKKTNIILLIGLCFSLVVANDSNAQSTSRLGIAARQHNEDSTLENANFGDELSYMLAYEWEEQQAFWQIAVDYAPNINTTNSVDNIITPQVNLLFRDKGWLGGMGILSSLVETDDGESDWSSAYYQMVLGFTIPFFGLKLNMSAYYQFDSFSDITSFEQNNIDYALWFKYTL